MPSRDALLLAEWLVESLIDHVPLFEMATERSEVRFKIMSYGPTIALHLLNVINFPDTQYINHWKGELKEFCDVIMTKNGLLQKPFESDELMSYLTSDRIFKIALLKYKAKWKRVPTGVSEIKEIIYSLCEAMVSNDPIEDVERIIDSL